MPGLCEMLSDPVPIGEHEPCGGSAACGWFAAQDHDTVVAHLDHVHEVSCGQQQVNLRVKILVPGRAREA